MKALQRREKSGGLYQIADRSHREVLLSISLSHQSLFSLSLPLQQCHSTGQPFNLHLFSCSLIKSEPRKKQKEKEKIKTHLVYVQIFHIRTKEMKEMRVRTEREPAGKSVCWDLECISPSPSSSEGLFLKRTSNSGCQLRKVRFRETQGGNQTSNQEREEKNWLHKC